MDDTPPGIRRLCVAVAAEGLDAPGSTGQQAGRERVSAALLDACGSAGLDRVLVSAQHTDDTEVVLLPVGIDEPRVIAALATALAEVLHRMNVGQGEGARVRLRMAVHEGITILTPEGFTGQAVACVSRLAGAQPLRAALAADPDADLMVMLSGQVFEDLVQFGHAGLSRDRFRRAEVAIPANGNLDAGWIHVPERAGR
jgi:hypothetical protein